MILTPEKINSLLELVQRGNFDPGAYADYRDAGGGMPAPPPPPDAGPGGGLHVGGPPGGMAPPPPLPGGGGPGVNNGELVEKLLTIKGLLTGQAALADVLESVNETSELKVKLLKAADCDGKPAVTAEWVRFIETELAKDEYCYDPSLTGRADRDQQIMEEDKAKKNLVMPNLQRLLGELARGNNVEQIENIITEAKRNKNDAFKKIERNINAIQTQVAQARLARDPTVQAKLEHIRAAKERFVELHTAIEGRAEGQEDYAYEEDEDYPALKAIADELEETQKELSKTKAKSRGFQLALEEARSKINSANSALEEERAKLTQNNLEIDGQLAGLRDGSTAYKIKQRSKAKNLERLEEIDQERRALEEQERQRTAADRQYLLDQVETLFTQKVTFSCDERKNPYAREQAFKVIKDHFMQLKEINLDEREELKQAIIDYYLDNDKANNLRIIVDAIAPTSYDEFKEMIGIRQFTAVTESGKPRLQSIHYLEQKTQLLQHNDAVAQLYNDNFRFEPRERAAHGVRRTGELKIAFRKARVERRERTMGVEKPVIVGMVYKKKGEKPKLIVPDEMDPETVDLSRLKYEVIKESDAKPDTGGLVEWEPMLDILTPNQMFLVASFLGETYPNQFDFTDPESVSEFKSDIKAKFFNSKIGIADILLVAFGIRHRIDDRGEYYENLQRLCIEGVKNTQDIDKGDLLFADQIEVEDERYPTVVNRENYAAQSVIDETENLTAELEAKRLQFTQAIATLREAVQDLDETINNPDNDKVVEAHDVLDALAATSPENHHQKPILDVLRGEPDVTTVETKQALSLAFVNALNNRERNENSLKAIEDAIRKVNSDRETFVRAQERLAQEAEALANRDRILQEIRNEIKLGMLFDSIEAEETEFQTRMLDQLAAAEYERQHGPLPAAEDNVQAAQADVGVQIQRVNQQIIEARAGGEISAEDLARLRGQLGDLEVTNRRLQEELEAIRALRAEPREAIVGAPVVSPEAVYSAEHNVRKTLLAFYDSGARHVEASDLKAFVMAYENQKLVRKAKNAECDAEAKKFNADPDAYKHRM